MGERRWIIWTESKFSATRGSSSRTFCGGKSSFILPHVFGRMAQPVRSMTNKAPAWTANEPLQTKFSRKGRIFSVNLHIGNTFLQVVFLILSTCDNYLTLMPLVRFETQPECPRDLIRRTTQCLTAFKTSTASHVRHRRSIQLNCNVLPIWLKRMSWKMKISVLVTTVSIVAPIKLNVYRQSEGLRGTRCGSGA